MELRVRLLNSFLVALAMLTSCNRSDGPVKMPVYSSAEINVRMQNGIAMTENTRFTGIVYTMYANKKDTAEIVAFNNGREHGEWKRFYPGNQLMEVRQFENGQKAGTFHAWWPNGAPKLSYHFTNGEYNGVCREWNDKRMLIKEMHYKNGYEDGSQKEFYNDGKVKANYVMISGRRYGLLGTKNCVNVSDSIFKN
jgi:antitoxin component YwqK of YwqJK toxin-antitoxin module